MKPIDADKLIEKLSAGLDNPEELPVISIGTVMRMIDSEEEIHTSQPEIVKCKDCKKAKKCFNYVAMRHRDGGYIHYPLKYCSEGERRTDADD